MIWMVILMLTVAAGAGVGAAVYFYAERQRHAVANNALLAKHRMNQMGDDGRAAVHGLTQLYAQKHGLADNLDEMWEFDRLNLYARFMMANSQPAFPLGEKWLPVSSPLGFREDLVAGKLRKISER